MRRSNVATSHMTKLKPDIRHRPLLCRICNGDFSIGNTRCQDYLANTPKVYKRYYHIINLEVCGKPRTPTARIAGSRPEVRKECLRNTREQRYSNWRNVIIVHRRLRYVP
jgi:hypothetical protein